MARYTNAFPRNGVRNQSVKEVSLIPVSSVIFPCPPSRRPAISGFVILPKDTSGKDLGLSGQCLRDRLLAVDSYGAVVLFVHDRLNWTVAVQLKIITFRGKEINNAACGLSFYSLRSGRGLTVNTNEWLGAEIVSAADERSVLFLRCQRGLCDGRDVSRGGGVHRIRKACGRRRHVRFPCTTTSAYNNVWPVKRPGFGVLRTICRECGLSLLIQPR